MELGSGSLRQEFPFSADKVYKALEACLPELNYKIKEKLGSIKRIEASYGATLFSWGENLSIAVSPIDDHRSNVDIMSSLKMGYSYTDRHQKHFRTIVMALGRYLEPA